LFERNITVIAFDQEAHGNSREKETDTYQGDENSLLDNAVHVVNTLAKEYMKEFVAFPTFLLGHAMGAITALCVTLSKHLQLPIRGVIATSPSFATKLEPNPWVVKIGEFAMKHLSVFTDYFKQREWATMDVKHLTSIEEIQGLFASSKQRFFGVNGSIGKAIFSMRDTCINNVHQFNTPILIFQSGNDEITNTEVTHKFVSEINEKCPKMYYGCPGLHDLLWDKNVFLIEKMICRWVAEQVGVQTSEE
jgi:alpha-beta hydrolase superfamily lysophospholipase